MLRHIFYPLIAISLLFSSIVEANTSIYRLEQFFSTLPNFWYFNEIRSMAIDSKGNLLVANSNSDVIKKISPNGFLIASLSLPSDQSQKAQPILIKVDDADQVYVFYIVEKNPNDKSVFLRLFNEHNQFIKEWTASNRSLWGYEFTMNQEAIYFYEYRNETDVLEIRKFAIPSLDTDNLSLLETREINPQQANTGKQRFDIRATEIDSQSFLYFLDQESNQVIKYDTVNDKVVPWNCSGSSTNIFDYPHDITIDLEDNVYIVNRNQSNVKKFTSDGCPIKVFANETHENVTAWTEALDKSYFVKMVKLLTQNEGQLNVRSLLGSLVGCDTAKNKCAEEVLEGLFGRASEEIIDGLAKYRRPFPHTIALAKKSLGNKCEVFIGYTYPNNAIAKYTEQCELASEWSNRGLFHTPFSILVDEDDNGNIKRIFVTDVIQHQVIILYPDSDIEPDILGSIGHEPGKFFFPMGIAQDSQGNIYVVDSGNMRIQKFNSEGRFLKTWGHFDKKLKLLLDNSILSNTLRKQARFSFDDIGRLISDLPIDVSDLEIEIDGIDIEQFVKAEIIKILVDANYNGFMVPTQIAIDEGDNIYVTDSLKGTVVKFDREGNWEKNIGRRDFTSNNQPSQAPDTFQLPFGVATYKDRTYITDAIANEIKVFDAKTGQFVQQYDKPDVGNQALNLPLGLAIDKNGVLYVANSEAHQFLKLTLTETEFESQATGQKGAMPGQFLQPIGLAVSRNGEQIFVADAVNNRVPSFRLTTYNPGKAVIFVGHDEKNSSLQDNLSNLAISAYETLLQKGFKPDEIRLFLPNPDALYQDINVEAESTRASLEAALTWGSDSDNLTLYLLGHGSNDAFIIKNTETFSVEDLQKFLNTNTTLVYEACESGSFIDDLLNSNLDSELTVISSTSSGEEATILTDGVGSFSRYFWSSVLHGASILEAFEAGKEAVAQKQTPRISHSRSEIAELYIGVPSTLRKERPTFVEDSMAFAIKDELLSISAEVVGKHPITSVTAFLFPINTNPDSTAFVNNTIQLKLTNTPLNSDRYIYHDKLSYLKGEYEIVISAVDDQKNSAYPFHFKETHFFKPATTIRGIIIGAFSSDPSDLNQAILAFKQQQYDDIQVYTENNRDLLQFNAKTNKDTIKEALKPALYNEVSSLVIYLDANVQPRGMLEADIPLTDTDTLTANELKSWLQELKQAQTALSSLTLVVNGDRSGVLLPLLEGLSSEENQSTIIITSTTDEGGTKSCPIINEFAQVFWRNVFAGMASTYHGFVNTQNELNADVDAKCSIKSKDIQAQMDTNGNGEYEEYEGYEYHQLYNLTRGTQIALNVPRIHGAQTMSTSPQNQLTFTANVTAIDSNINDVRAELIPRKKGEPVLSITLSPTSPNCDKSCNYRATQTLTGQIEYAMVRYYAKDAKGRVSRTALTMLEAPKTCNINLQQACQAGERLIMPLFAVAPSKKRYLAIRTPAGDLYMLSDTNQIEAFNPNALLDWPNDKTVALEGVIPSNLAKGTYTLYQLTIPKTETPSPEHANPQYLKETHFEIH